MIFTKLNVVFERFSEENNHLTRQWRNSDFVRREMMYDSYISEEQHSEWFKQINNDKNYYFIAKYKDRPVAVVNLKDVTEISAEAGIYLTSEDEKKSLVVARVVMALGDFGFIDLGLERLYSTVKVTNKSAIALNTKFGAVLVPERGTHDANFYIFERDRYFVCTESMRAHFSK